jgi:hypothetical protein
MEPTFAVLILMVARIGIPIAVLALISFLYSRSQLRHTH